jgi:hypothetical protein
MKNSSHIFWHSINKHEKKKFIIMKKFKKGLGVLFGQFLFLDHSLKLFLMGPPNCTCTPFMGYLKKNSRQFQHITSKQQHFSIWVLT